MKIWPAFVSMMILLLLCSKPAIAQCDGQFVRTEGASNFPLSIYTKEWSRHGVSSAFAYGTFTQIENVPANNVAEFVDRRWVACGVGVNGPVWGAVAFQGAVVITGPFTAAGGRPMTKLARWDGLEWSSIGEAPNGDIQGILVHRGELLVFGNFTRIGGIEALRVAAWNGTDWRPLGAGWTSDGRFTCSVEWDGKLYVGTSGTALTDPASRALVSWDGSTWSAVGGGLPISQVSLATRAIDVHQGVLYVGTAYFANGYRCQIDSWDGVSWRRISNEGSGFHSMRSFGSTLFVASDESFRASNGADVQYNPHGSTGVVWGLSVQHGVLYVSGQFSGAFTNLAAWDGIRWSGFDEGPVDSVSSVTRAADHLFVSGPRAAGGVRSRGVCELTETGWRELGGGVSGSVATLATIGDRLVAGGLFTDAGGAPALNIASWNGSQWGPMGSGLNDRVISIAQFGQLLVAGGSFTRSGATPVNRIAAWDGTAWSAFGDGFADNSVNDLAVFQGELYASGTFTRSGSRSVSGVARWRNGLWESVWPLSSSNLKLCVYRDRLYAVGSFDFENRGGIAMWDGVSWSPLGLGIRNNASAGSAYLLSVVGDQLFVAGSFTTAGGFACGGEAMWDGQSWTPAPDLNFNTFDVVDDHGIAVALQSLVYVDQNGRPKGVGRIRRLESDRWVEPWGEWNNVPSSGAIYRNALVVGGSFTVADRIVAGGLARWEFPLVPTISTSTTELRVRPRGEAHLSVAVSGTPQPAITWTLDGVVVSDGPSRGGGVFVGATTAALSLLNSGPADSGRYEATASNGCGTASVSIELVCCPPDFNIDGFLDFFDYADFVACFEGSGCPNPDPLAADFNADGFVDFFDYADFVAAFETGC